MVQYAYVRQTSAFQMYFSFHARYFGLFILNHGYLQTNFGNNEVMVTVDVSSPSGSNIKTRMSPLPVDHYMIYLIFCTSIRRHPGYLVAIFVGKDGTPDHHVVFAAEIHQHVSVFTTGKCVLIYIIKIHKADEFVCLFECVNLKNFWIHFNSFPLFIKTVVKLTSFMRVIG